MTSKQFNKYLEKVMQTNEYAPNMTTVTECAKKNYWTPCDLIMREYLNNGGGSARGFLGISKQDCEKCYRHIMDCLEYFIGADMISETGTNNAGYELWTNYNREAK